MSSKSSTSKPSKSKSRTAKPAAEAVAAVKKSPASKKAGKTVKIAASAPLKEKRIRGSFSMPISDYTLIAELKSRSKTAGRPVKKNELLRAGLQTLGDLSNDALQAALQRLGPVAAKAPKKSGK